MSHVEWFCESRRHEACRQSVRVHAPQRKQAIGLTVWKRLQQYGIDDAENGGIGSDSERQCDDRDSRVQGLARELSNREPEVALEVMQVSHHSFLLFKAAVDLVAFRHNRVAVSELAARFCCGSVRPPPGFDEFGRTGLDMELHFIAEIAVDISPPEGQVSPPHRGLARHGSGSSTHAGFSVAATTLPTASANRDQAESSR
jgi:hypothetical protein